MSVDPRFPVTVLGSPRAIVAPLASPRGAVALHDAKRAAVAPLRAPRLPVAHPTLALRDPSTLPEAEPLNVPSIAALRQITGVLNGTVSMVGGLDGGIFVYDSARANEDNGGTVHKGHVRVFSGPADARWFGAKGDGTAADHAALAAAFAVSDHVELKGTHRISANFTVPYGKKLHAEDGMLSIDAGATVTVAGEYDAGLRQVFSGPGSVHLSYRKRGIVRPEHFGAVVMSNPKSSTEDSTTALQKMFLSLQGNTTYNPNVGDTPAPLDAPQVHFAGIYGISDEIKVQGGSCRIYGNGPSFSGSGLKWLGADVVGNATKSLLRIYGPQFMEIEGLIFLGLPTATDANRLYSLVALQALGSVPSPFHIDSARRVVIHRCTFGDDNGIFQQYAGYQAVHGIVVDGDNGNGDFGVIDTCIVTGCEYGITITNQQNVYWQVRNCGAGYVKAGLWLRSGTEVQLDGFYVYNLPSGGTWIRVGDPALLATQGAPNVRIVGTQIAGEGNELAAGFIANAGGWTTTLSLDLRGCEISGGGGMPFFATGAGLSDCAVIMTARACRLFTAFTLATDSPGLRSVLSFEACRDLGSFTITNPCGYTTVEVDVRGCWAGWFAATPPAFGNAGRFLGPLNFRKRFVNQSTISLGDTSLYGATSAMADSIAVGDPTFGLESKFVSKTFRFGTLAQLTQTVAAIPARSQVLGVTVAVRGSNYLANSNTGNALIYVGDATDYKRFATLSGPNGNTQSAPTEGYVPFTSSAGQSVILKGGFALTGSFAWSGNTVTAPTGQFTAAMVGNRVRVGSTEGVITAYVDSTHVTMDTTGSTSGTAVMFVPFVAGTAVLVTVTYVQLNSSPPTSWVNTDYAEAITAT
jgi:hypothetical protein